VFVGDARGQYADGDSAAKPDDRAANMQKLEQGVQHPF
jgi:hypothetical protein